MQRRLTSIPGNTQKLDGGAMFGNAPREMWSQWAPPDDRNRIDLACRGLLITEPDRKILCETGIGAFFDPKMKDQVVFQADPPYMVSVMCQLRRIRAAKTSMPSPIRTKLTGSPLRLHQRVWARRRFSVARVLRM